MEEVTKPDPAVNEVLVKIKKTAICGTDLHIYEWDSWAEKTVKPGTIVGHEFMGIVEAVGEGVSTVKEGDRVTGEGHIACDRCRNCRRGRKHICEKSIGIGIHTNGIFADYAVIPASNIIPISDKVSDEVASIMDPLGNAAHTALSFPVVGEDVLITGAGLIGNMAVAICQHVGARNIVVTDLSDERLSFAKKFGASYLVNRSKGESIGGAIQKQGIRGFDVGLEMSGSAQAFNSMIGHMYNGSNIALLGILPEDTRISWSEIIFKSLTIKGIYGREMFETWYKMEQLLVSGMDISPIISHRLNAEDFEMGFKTMKEGNCGKIIMSWN